MTDFAGNFAFLTRYATEPTNPAIGSRGYDVTKAEKRFYSDFGTLGDTQPIDEVRSMRVGNSAPYFEFLHFYNRIHVSPLIVNLGNLISEQIRPISVFNGYFESHELESITPANDNGLTLTQPVGLPAHFNPLQERIYELNAAPFGAPDVDATYTFVFDVVTVIVEVIGTRVVCWSWEPNWATPPKERLEWFTDVMKSFNGKEQRFELRDGARQYWEFAFDVMDEDRKRFETIYYGWGARPWALPQWMDGSELPAFVASGAAELLCEPQGRDYRVGGLAILIGGRGEIFEAFEIGAVASDRIIAARPLLNNWPAGSRLYPGRTARLLDPRALSRLTRGYSQGTASFRSMEQIEYPAADELLYRGFPVMEAQPNWREAPTIQYDRVIAEFDGKTGNIVYDDESGFPELVNNWQWTLMTRAQCVAAREWFYARAGRFRSFWLPSWASDMTMATILGASATQIDIRRIGIKQYINAGAGRRDIRIRLHDGTIYYRRVSGFDTVDESTERMTLNAATGRQISPAEIDVISWMSLARLDSDSVEIDWENWSVAETAVVTRSVNNDV